MVRLVDDLMEVSRITRGKIDLQLRAAAAAERCIDDAIELSRPLMEAGRPCTGWSRPKRAADCCAATRVRLTQVFSNLLNNAAKYTPPGGRSSVVAARREGDEAVVEVIDNGIGLAPEMLRGDLRHVRAGRRTARKMAQGGLGIGLTLVKSLVELHGGSVRASSAGLDQGATFTVRLPLAR